MNIKTDCDLANGFKLWEKFYAQSSFIGIGAIGITGIVLVNPLWVVPYLFIYGYGILGVVMRHLVCPRCPHLYDYNDCLQFPPKLTLLLIKKRKMGHPFTQVEKILFYLIFIFIPVYPIYFLLQTPALLGGFLLLNTIWYAGQYLYFCKRCRVKECPSNRVKWTQ